MKSSATTANGPNDNRNRVGQTLSAAEHEPPKQPSLVDWKSIAKPLSAVAGLFLLIFFLPMDSSRFTGAVIESLALAKWYATFFAGKEFVLF